jgi:ATP-binding cassette subfamily B protein
MRLLTRMYDPTAGRITLDGTDLRDLPQAWLRSTLGIVPQEGFLFSATVADNIRYGRPDASMEEVLAAAATVGATPFIESLEHGFETMVGERGSRLSAGQRQLVSFARALLTDPPLLVLDEATSSVDVETELRLADGMRSLVAGRTAFVVAHRLSTIRSADLVVVVDDGRIVEHGTHEELAAADGHYANLYGSWRGRERTIEASLDS